MTLNDAADIAQVISAVVVIVSLIYVAREVRHNSHELQLSTQQAQADAASNYLLTLGTDPDFANLVYRMTPPNVPAPTDYVRVSLLMNGVFAQFQAGWEAARTQRSELRPWWTYQEAALAGWLESRPVVDWWQRDRQRFSEGFRKLVDARIAALEAEGRIRYLPAHLAPQEQAPRGAEVGDEAGLAAGPAGEAGVAPVQDQPVVRPG